MGRLTDILQGSDANSLRDQWNETNVDELEPLPSGVYSAEIVTGELCANHKGTPEYKLTFRVSEGEYTDRRCWLDLWLTKAAMVFTKRSLAKLGVTSPDQLERPLPKGIMCSLNISLRADDTGVQRNRITAFDVVEVRPAKGLEAGSKPPGEQTSGVLETFVNVHGDAEEVPF